MSVNLTLKKKSKILSGATKLIYVFFDQSCAVDSVRQELGNFSILDQGSTLKR